MTSTRSHTTNPNKVVHLPASAVEILIHSNDTFTAKFFELGLHVSDHANRVSLSAGAGNSIKTFDYGTVAQLVVPTDTSLSSLEGDKPRVFRLIVWDAVSRRITASNERLRTRDFDAPADRDPLLPVRMTKLDGEVWKLSLTDDARPELLLNSEIPGLKHQLASRPELRGAVLPEAARQCLLHVCASPDYDDADTDAWQVKWLRFADSFGVDRPDDWPKATPSACREWANQVVALWAHDVGFAKLVASAWSGEGDD